MATPEETALHAYVDAFNRHDLDGVMACFAGDAVIVDMSGERHEGAVAIREFYEWQFRAFPHGRCDIERVSGADGTGVAQTVFRGTHVKSGKVVTARGAEVVVLHDHHQLTPA